jgi:hypothetical protein
MAGERGWRWVCAMPEQAADGDVDMERTARRRGSTLAMRSVTRPWRGRGDSDLNSYTFSLV